MQAGGFLPDNPFRLKYALIFGGLVKFTLFNLLILGLLDALAA
jgi:hypothetical protein